MLLSPVLKLSFYAMLLALAACKPVSQSLIKIDGSSTVFPITEAASEQFQAHNETGVRVTVGISGTGGGFKKFCRGAIDITGASRPILGEEMQACKAAGIEYIELPIAYDALTVVINQANDWAPSMTVAELKMIWEPEAQGKIERWSQVRAGWPDAPLTLYGAGSDSGTFDYFTEAVTGKAKSSRGDYTASEDDNVLVQGVSQDKNALGYFGYAYYGENQDKLKAVAIDNGKGATVLPSVESVENGSYQPLARPVFIYVKGTALNRPEVRQFVEFYLRNAAVLAQDVGYVPLSDAAYDSALEHLKEGRLGSVFGGESAVGITIEELLKREGKL
jgi:phosphate transport system substrate-binding protein